MSVFCNGFIIILLLDFRRLSAKNNSVGGANGNLAESQNVAFSADTNGNANRGAGGNGNDNSRSASDTVSQTVRTFFPETWLWDLVTVG